MSLGTGEPPSSQVWAGPLSPGALSRLEMAPSPGLLPQFSSPTCAPPPRVPLPHVCPSPRPLRVFLSCVFVSLSFRLSWFLGLSVFLSESPSPLSPSIFVQSRPHRLLLPTPPPLPPPLGGPLPHPRSTFQPPPPPRRPSPEPAAAVVGSRDAAGRLELKSKVGSRRGLERAPPNNSGMWAGPAPRGWGKEVARPQMETAGDGWLHLPCAQPTP